MSGSPCIVAVPTTGGTLFVGPFPTAAAAEGYRTTITRTGGVMAGARVVAVSSPVVVAEMVERCAPAVPASLSPVRDTGGVFAHVASAAPPPG